VKNIFLKTLKLLGVVMLTIVFIFMAGILWPLDVPQPKVKPERLIIQNAMIVDVESGVLRQGEDIFIQGGQIISVGDGSAAEMHDLAAAFANAQIVDAAGQFAIPGMFDMHTHAFKMAPYLTHPLYVAAGVTAVRDMGGCLGADDAWFACSDDKRVWNERVNAGQLVAPRFDQVTGLAINGGNAIPDGFDISLGGGTAEGARARASFDKARGIDFLKTYSELPREGYFALAEEAPNQGMYLAGHLPFAVTAIEGIEAGQRSFEHAFFFIWGCYPGMLKLRQTGDIYSAFTNEARSRMIAEHDATVCEDLRARMVRSGATYVPTHTTRKLDAYALDSAFRSDPRLKYIPAPLRMMWLEDADNMARRAGEGGEKSYKAIYEFGLKQTGLAHKAGVVVLAGTDAPDSFVFPGLGMQDELDHFIRAGLSPLEALQTATLAPAQFLGLEGVAGIIAAGARADIVLLRANPIEDINAVEQIETVILAGTVYDRKELDGMLQTVEGNANSWTMWPKFAWQIVRSPLMLKQFAD